jgi:hypothetical protein
VQNFILLFQNKSAIELENEWRYVPIYGKSIGAIVEKE